PSIDPLWTVGRVTATHGRGSKGNGRSDSGRMATEQDTAAPGELLVHLRSTHWDWAADHRSHLAAHLAGGSGSVAAGPRKVAGPLGPVKAAAAYPEARAFLVVEHKAARMKRAISDPSYACSIV